MVDYTKSGLALSFGEADQELLRKLLVLHEAEKSHWYADSKGYATIGIGRCIELGVGPGLRACEMNLMAKNNFQKELPNTGPAYTHLQKRDGGVALLGPGRDVGPKGPGLFPDEIECMFWNDMASSEAEAMTAFPWYEKLSAVRKAVVIDMLHQLGLPKLRRKFPKFQLNMKRGYWQAAGWEIVWSELAQRRAERLKLMMISDDWPKELL